MLNQIVLVGRIAESPVIEEKGEKKITRLTLAVQRPFKNSEGIYETDFIPCILWNGVAENVCEYCKQGDIVGVKGRLQSYNNTIEVVADRVTFLSSKKQDEE